MTAAAPDRRHPTHLLVTGGAGFIGANFVRQTLENHPDTQILMVDALTYAANPANLRDDANTPWEEAFPGRFRFLHRDLADKNSAADAVAALVKAAAGETQRCAVVHFAAESHNDNSLLDPGIFVRSNIVATSNLLEAVAHHGVYLHHVSTDEVFGDLALDDPRRFTTDTPYRPSSPYSASKAAADHLVRAFVRSLGIEATISNCSNNYGPRQHPEKFIPRQITGLLEGQRPRLYGRGDNVRDWIHVDDHNDAVWTILRRGTPGETYLIGANGERSNRQVVADILRIFGRQPDDFDWVSDRPGHDRRYAIDPSSIHALGWKPRYTNFQDGLAHTVQWYRNNPQWWRGSRLASEEKYRATEEITGSGN